MKEYKGTVTANAHRIAFNFWADNDFPEEFCERLKNEAESRAKEMTAEDYSSGELNYEDGQYYIRGWWEIEGRQKIKHTAGPKLAHERIAQILTLTNVIRNHAECDLDYGTLRTLKMIDDEAKAIAEAEGG